MISSNASAGGGQAVDFNAITSGANVVNNYATGLLKALEADAVRPGVERRGQQLGHDPVGHHHRQQQRRRGRAGQHRRESSTTAAARSRADATASPAARPMPPRVHDDGHQRLGAHDPRRQRLGHQPRRLQRQGDRRRSPTHGTIIGNGITGDGDGVDVDGLVTLINTGVIRSLNAVPDAGEALAFSEGLSVGGGTITNSGTIEGLVAPGNTRGQGHRHHADRQRHHLRPATPARATASTAMRWSTTRPAA